MTQIGEFTRQKTGYSGHIVPMLERFIATDRGFAKARRQKPGGEASS